MKNETVNRLFLIYTHEVIFGSKSTLCKEAIIVEDRLTESSGSHVHEEGEKHE
jgi:hypothetical protein